jgi:hypothetical protein
MDSVCRRILLHVQLCPVVLVTISLDRFLVSVFHLESVLGSVLPSFQPICRDTLCIAGTHLRFFVWRILIFCSLAVHSLFCMHSLSRLVTGGIARMVEKCLQGLERTGTSCRILPHTGFSAAVLLVVVCGCDVRTIHSRDHNKPREKAFVGVS